MNLEMIVDASIEIESVMTNIIVEGNTGNEGLAIGSVLVVDHKKKIVQPATIPSRKIAKHLSRFNKAKKEALIELEKLISNLDTTTSEVIEAQMHIIEDEEIQKKVYSLIEQELFTVDYAIYKTFSSFIERLKQSDNEFFKQRIIDLEYIRDRLITLSCNEEKEVIVEKGAILIIDEISPTDLVEYYEKGISGLVIDKGGVTSHAAIIAQSLNLPCIVSAKKAVKSALNANKAILNATNGILIIDPDADTLSKFKKQKRKYQRLLKSKTFVKEGTETTDGVQFVLRANLEFVQELPLLKKSNANGIGLLRTEALLYGGVENRDEAKQITYYRKILSDSKGLVTIRLFDVGGDKLHILDEDTINPFLGWRGIRVLLDEKDILITQLKSILKISNEFPDRIQLLVPMVTTVEEIQAVRQQMGDVVDLLKSEGVDIKKLPPLGIMVEVPSVALIASHFTPYIDFFSIGTNDLTQYTLAVDRGNDRIADLYQQIHPSIWQLIQLTYTAAKNAHIEISVCGELAGNKMGAACLFGIGIFDLSMAPSHIPKIRELFSSHSYDKFKLFAQKSLTASSSAEVKTYFSNIFE